MTDLTLSPWPSAGLDVDALRSSGWRPYPFNEFVIKIHSRCNLACDYCYMYEMIDQSWRDQPMLMAEEIFIDACRGIADHVSRFEVPAVSLVFHGGEPLLAGHARFEFFARHARECLGPLAEVRLGVQTNGVLIDEEFLRICDQWGVVIGVSLDGGRNAHDRHRKSRRGDGSYDDVARGVEQLRKYRNSKLFGGLLCTIDLANDPIQTYEELLAFCPPGVDFLLPHSNWESPPQGKIEDQEAAPYAEWLIPIFDRWYGAPEVETQIRLFDNIIHLLFGGRGRGISVGHAPIQVAIIETDGTLEQVDSLKSTFSGATRIATIANTGMGDRLNHALWDPGIVARQIGSAALSDTCMSCSLRDICGGGDYVHRYRADTGFQNPSVYCSDLAALIRHIKVRLEDDLDKVTTK
ncbi:FxsB family cyclophane-forming radical SAM/SPASM peptide maturase [Nocardia sp. NPDC049190]|uniref:FxsB family cyclophane-forming radical SAM/SPASM peptide maturase n=1 Tax=Nocardia sp. NPDC049190 TaxID=3155650 RepID=UPI0033C80DE1